MEVTVVTLNCRGFRKAIKDGLATWLLANRPDFVCLQELACEDESAMRKAVGVQFESLLDGGYRPEMTWQAGIPNGTGILSLHPFKTRDVKAPFLQKLGHITVIESLGITISSLYMRDGLGLSDLPKVELVELFRRFGAESVPHVVAADTNIIREASDRYTAENLRGRGQSRDELDLLNAKILDPSSRWRDAFRVAVSGKAPTWWANTMPWGSASGNRLDTQIVTKELIEDRSTFRARNPQPIVTDQEYKFSDHAIVMLRYSIPNRAPANS